MTAGVDGAARGVEAEADGVGSGGDAEEADAGEGVDEPHAGRTTAARRPRSAHLMPRAYRACRVSCEHPRP
jgi:hypothetical protein